MVIPISLPPNFGEEIKYAVPINLTAQGLVVILTDKPCSQLTAPIVENGDLREDTYTSPDIEEKLEKNEFVEVCKIFQKLAVRQNDFELKDEIGMIIGRIGDIENSFRDAKYLHPIPYEEYLRERCKVRKDIYDIYRVLYPTPSPSLTTQGDFIETQ